MKSWKDDSFTRTEPIGSLTKTRAEALDFVAAVEGLHDLSPDQLVKLIKDSGNKVVRYVSEDGTHVQVDFEKLTKHLPLHLIAVTMAWERNKSTFKYLLCGIILLHSLCDLASRLPKIDQILFDDVKVSGQVIDLVCYMLVVLAAYGQENHDMSNDVVLLHAALVASSLKLLKMIVSPQYQEIAQVVVSYHKVDVFLDAAFTCACADVKFLQDMLSARYSDAAPADEEALIHLCQQCDSTLLILQLLCEQNLFRECVIRNKELCSNGGALMLIYMIVNLKHNDSCVAQIFRLKSKALSILLYLCEAEKVSYLDEVFGHPRCQSLAKSVAQKVLEILKEMFATDPKYQGGSSEVIYPKAQVELNAMRLADVFSDDTNFRSFIMINFTEDLASMFSRPHGKFVSGWCSSDYPAFEDDTTANVPKSSYAHQKTSLLVKVMANLHCSAEDVCPDEKDQFLKDFARFLEKRPQTIADGTSPAFDAGKTVNVHKNLRSLLSHAESLVPGLLNEEDVKLLRLFTGQFNLLIGPAAFEDRRQGAWNSEANVTPLGSEVVTENGNDINIEESTAENVTFQPVELLNVSTNVNDLSVEKEGRTSITLRDMERDARAVETSGSDSSPIGRKSSMDRMDDHVQGSGNDEPVGDEKIEAQHSDDKQQRKRKRTVMNDKQIALIESAIVDEPDMHRNAPALRIWAEKLSLHGAEVTTSRLKNWLNNRKAKLARAAKDSRPSHEGDKLERQGSSGRFESPQSPVDDPRVSSKGSSSKTEFSDTPITTKTNEVVGTSSLAVLSQDVGKSVTCLEPGQQVMLVGENAEEIGKGKVYQSSGIWFGQNLDQSSLCVVDITELSVDINSKLPHPVEARGNTFYQAEKKLAVVRVLWDVKKLVQLPAAR